MIKLRLPALLLLLLAPSALPAQDAPEDPYTDKSRRTMERATNWLLSAQNKDGSWGLDKGSPGDVTCTAVAGLALISAGNTERNGPDSRAVDALRAATDWTMKLARKAKGDIVAGQVTLIQNKLGVKVHNFFGVVFLTQVYGMRPTWLDASELGEMRDAISTLVNIIAASQEPDGSWSKDTWGSLKATCMAWMALRSASSAGLEIRHAVVEKTVQFIRKQYNPASQLYDKGISGGYQSLYATASSVRVLWGMGLGESQEAARACDAFLKSVKGGSMGGQFLTVEGEDYLSTTMMAHALIHEEGPRWKAYWAWARDELVKKQNPDGSWVTTACITGRTFPTACGLMTLQTPYRLLPLQEQ